MEAMLPRGETRMKKRQVNFELLRILCMYMIVVGHCLFHGRVTAKLGFGTTNYFLSYLIQAFSIVHVNCFVMLSGYFSIDKHGQLHKPSNASVCSQVDAAAYKRRLFHLLTY